MKPQSGTSLSLWAAITEVPQFPALKKNSEADVCIIGAGITGLTCAYLLTLEGKKVIVLEDGTIASGETARTTAHITNIIDDRYYKVEYLHGEEGARLAANSQTAAIDKIEEIVTTENISCDFSRLDGYLFFSEKEKDDTIEKEFEATKRVGIQVIKVNDAPVKLSKRNPVFMYPGQAQFNALRYIAGLAQTASDKGAQIYTHTHASKIEREEKQVTIATSEGLKVSAKD